MSKNTKNIFITFGIGCLVFLIGNALYKGFAFENMNALVLNLIFYQLYAFVLGYSNMYFFDYIERYPWKDKDSLKRISIGISGSIVITLVGLFILRMTTAMFYENESFDTFITNESYRNYTFGLWITLTIVITFHAVYFFKKNQEEKVKESQIVAQTQTAKFDALKNQLDPHFLFNSLNVLTSLIEENPHKAQNFTTSLSKIYRYVLEQKNKDLVSVDEELKFAKTYMFLLKMRFEDSIVFDIPEQASNPDSKVIPLSLQLLLENAVKHNMVTEKKPLHIKIYEDQGNLIVENNLQIKQMVKKGSGVGLSNIMQRYHLLTKRKVNIYQQANSFAVSIPMLTKQITIMETHSIHNREDAYYRAKKQVDEIKGFYGNLISYSVIIPIVIFINYKTSWDNMQWFWFPLLGWGMGVIFHGFAVFGYGKSWEQRKIKEILDKEETMKQNKWS